MFRYLLLIHRYLGIGISIILLLWCLSGFVMMYKPYPELSYQQQLSTLQALELDNCCSFPAIEDSVFNQYQLFQILMINGEATLHLYSSFGQLETVNLSNGVTYQDINEAEALAISNHFASTHAYAQAALLEKIDTDQWTIGNYNQHRPLYHFSANDNAGTEWYLSSRSGEIVQLTTREQRFWGYLGAVVHWIYPTKLRQNAQLWTQLVIWLSVLGVFLTLTGLYIGILRFKPGWRSPHSPYHGLSLWHHYAGLIFGILTLSWVLSGLFSMQPWGLLTGSGAGQELRRLNAGSISMEEVETTLQKLNDFSVRPGTMVIEGRKLDGQLYLYTINDHAETLRYDSRNLEPMPINEAELVNLAHKMLPETEIKHAALSQQEDNYYFSHHDSVKLPVFKIESGGENPAIYYLDPDNAELLAKYDSGSRWYRWLHYGLHRLDFTPGMRSRPLWDIMMWILLGGVTLGVFSGFLLGIRRVYRSVRN